MENARLTKLLAEAELDKGDVEGVGQGKMVTTDRRGRAPVVLRTGFGWFLHGKLVIDDWRKPYNNTWHATAASSEDSALPLLTAPISETLPTLP